MISPLSHTPELDKYELLDEIGHGGMATVYRALDRRLGRQVAVKLIHRHLRENTQVAARFVAEARAVARLRHPNIVEVFDISEQDDPERYLVVELIRGPTLRAVIAQHQGLPPEVAAGIALELCDALAHAHREGVIHRDIKPENVLISEGSGSSGGSSQPRVKLTDFGIAKLLDAQGVTSTGQVLGSPAHMAPEQIEGGEVDARSDVFALGVLLYECMTGSLPFQGKNPAQVLRCVLDGIYSPADRVRPAVGGRWNEILDRALNREPAGRYPSIDAFAEDIRAALAEVEIPNPAAELTAFFSSPESYVESFPAKIGHRLLASGAAARKAKDFQRANQQLNRALVYLPGNAEVLRQVSGLAKRRRLAGMARVLGIGAGVVLVGALGVVTVRSVSGSAVAESEVASPAATPPAVASPPRSPVIRAEPVVSQPGPVPPSPRTVRRKRPVIVPPANSVTTPVSLRRVAVRITGATGGRLRIDGEERAWFGQHHELPVGEHLFEFVPPNDTCCVPATQRVLIKEGPGTQNVVGRIEFKPAVLQVQSAVGGRARMACPTLFFGEFSVPGSRTVSMSRAEVSESCTITPNNKASAPMQKLVTLRAGQTTVIPWP